MWRRLDRRGKPGGERGLYKSTDGGTTWKLIKAPANDKTGAIDVQIDPSNPDVLYLSMWERYRTPYSLLSGGVGSGLFKSTDAGATWTEIKGNGYPEGPKGRIGLAISRSNPQVVYALTEAASMEPGPMKFNPANQATANGLYRSADGGKTWQHMNNIDVRPFYYSQVRVDPKNENRVYFSSTTMQVSNDGGKTNMDATVGVHVDDHAVWIDPNDGERWVVGMDGGIAITYDRGGNFWYPRNLPIGQFYDASFDYAIPYNVCSGAQDNGAWCGPSRRRSTPINNTWWFTICGGDGFYTAQDPTDPTMVWGESQNAGIQQTNLKTGERGRVNKPTWNERYRMWEDSIAIVRGNPLEKETPEMAKKIAAYRVEQKKDSADFQIRYNWESPYFLSPHNPQVFYLGGSRVLKSLKRGEDLFPISPDLSVKKDPAQEKARLARLDTVENYTGGITLDLTGAEAYGTVVALQESPLKPGFLLAGTDDGNVWLTHNDGGAWEDLTPKFTALGVPWDAYVVRVEPSHFDTLTFYVAFENHRWNDFKPYVFATNDGGRTFRSIVNNLPSVEPRGLSARDPRGSAQPRPAVCRQLAHGVRLDRPWADVVASLGQPADGAGVRSPDSSSRPRADRGDARPQSLGRRHRGSRADDAQGRRAGHVPVQAEDGLSVGRSAAAQPAGQRFRAGGDDVREPAVRRRYRLSSRGRRAEHREARDFRRERRLTRDDQRCGWRGSASRRLEFPGDASARRGGRALTVAAS